MPSLRIFQLSFGSIIVRFRWPSGFSIEVKKETLSRRHMAVTTHSSVNSVGGVRKREICTKSVGGNGRRMSACATWAAATCLSRWLSLYAAPSHLVSPRTRQWLPLPHRRLKHHHPPFRRRSSRSRRRRSSRRSTPSSVTRTRAGQISSSTPTASSAFSSRRASTTSLFFPKRLKRRRCAPLYAYLSSDQR